MLVVGGVCRLANFPTCQLVGFSTCWEVEELAYRAAGLVVYPGVRRAWIKRAGAGASAGKGLRGVGECEMPRQHGGGEKVGGFSRDRQAGCRRGQAQVRVISGGWPRRTGAWSGEREGARRRAGPRVLGFSPGVDAGRGGLLGWAAGCCCGCCGVGDELERYGTGRRGRGAGFWFTPGQGEKTGRLGWVPVPGSDEEASAGCRHPGG